MRPNFIFALGVLAILIAISLTFMGILLRENFWIISLPLLFLSVFLGKYGTKEMSLVLNIIGYCSIVLLVLIFILVYFVSIIPYSGNSYLLGFFSNFGMIILSVFVCGYLSRYIGKKVN